MNMSTDNTQPGYQALASVLTQQGTGMTPAEMHGLISGIVCGGNKDHSWKTLVHDLTNEGLAFSQSLSQPLQELHAHIQDTLEEEGFLFQLLLPDEDESSVFERADALAGWVNHFLLGLGVTQPKLDKVKGEAGEAIDDLRTIAQLGYDEEDDREELAQSLEEVIEYVRVAAVLCHETFNQPVMPIAPEAKKPTLH
jgi:yecA family protein